MATYIHSLIHSFADLISIDEIKVQLKLGSNSSEDALIEQYIYGAIMDAENYTCTSINEAKFRIDFIEWAETYAIPLSPIQSIDSVIYTDENGDPQTLSAELYELRPLDKYQFEIYFNDVANLPTIKAATYIKIAVTTGYNSAADLPMALKQAIFLIVSSYYEGRQDSVEVLPKASTNILSKYRFYY